MTESDLKQKVLYFFNNLSITNLALVEDFYSPTAEFCDPIVSLSGLASIRGYYQELYKNVEEIRFEFGAVVAEDSKLAAPWVMHLTAPKLKRNGAVVVPGISHIVFNTEGKAQYHRDYFDMGAFVYENVPALGGVIRFIKRRLHP